MMIVAFIVGMFFGSALGVGTMAVLQIERDRDG